MNHIILFHLIKLYLPKQRKQHNSIVALAQARESRLGGLPRLGEPLSPGRDLK